MNLNMKVLDIGCIIIIIIAVVGGISFLQFNFSRHSSQLKLEKEQLSDQKNRLKIVLAQFEQLQSQFMAKQDQIRDLNKRVPKTPGMGELLSQLNGLVKQRDILLIDFNHKPAQGLDRYKRIPVQIMVTGDFLNIYRLIHDLETLNRVFIFDNIMIERREENNACQATLMASVFQQ